MPNNAAQNRSAKTATAKKSDCANAAILLAGGSGKRMRGTVKDKVLAPLAGLPVILRAFGAFLESGKIGEYIFVCRDAAQQREIKNLIKKHFPNTKAKIKFTRGGAERQDSVLNGLREVSDKSALAFIHDGARPMITPENITSLAEAATRDGAAVLASRVSDTIKRVAKNKKTLEKCALADLDRKRLWAMQTPQVFGCAGIEKAYEKIAKSGASITDDVAAWTSNGGRISIVENASPNPKITTPQDIALVEFLMRKGF